MLVLWQSCFGAWNQNYVIFVFETKLYYYKIFYLCGLQLNNFEIKPGKFLKVNASVANVRLFVGNIPKNRARDEIYEEFQKATGNINDQISSSVHYKLYSTKMCHYTNICK